MHKPAITTFLLGVFLWATTLPLSQAATVLLDFEVPEEIVKLHDEGRDTLGGGKTVVQAREFATSGSHSLRFSVPKWEPGRPQWPAWEFSPVLTNWSGYDRLTFAVSNPGEHPQTLSLFISGSKVATRDGLAHTVKLGPWAFERVVIPLVGLAEKKVNPSEIRVLHFFTSETPGDMNLYLDQLTLLKPGEPLPAVSASFRHEFASMQTNLVNGLRHSVTKARERLTAMVAGSPALSSWVQRELSAFTERVGAFSAGLTAADPDQVADTNPVANFRSELQRLETITGFCTSFVALGPDRTKAAQSAGLAIGYATSMEKVLPRHDIVAARATNRIEVSLARNEEEAFQVLVLPYAADAKSVRVKALDLHSSNGKRLAPDRIKAIPVGYVRTIATPPYGTSHIGWWPDPVLEFMDQADIAKGDLQAFWVRVSAPKDQPPGRYQGKLEVSVEGKPVFTFDLAIRIYDFAVPDGSPLPLAITFAPHDWPLPENEKAEWRKAPDYPVIAWRKHKTAWADFLADYYITFDSLYHGEVPDFALLSRLHQQGRLGKFNLGYYGHPGTKPEELARWKEQTLPRLREGYTQAKAAGLLDHAYIYGCDEAVADLFPRVQQAARILKAEFPGVPIMTTTYDQTYGMDSVIKAMDAFCPLTPSFDMTKAAGARGAGRDVWWYICCGPHHPHLNMFIEYPAIEGRLLMGAMTTKYRPDGFLYYQISIWNSRKPITSGPFTDWDPRSWTTYHGDGSWTCVGPEGMPLPTVRLENFRDGLEDYAYTLRLEELVKRVEATPALRAEKSEWLHKAKALLEVPSELLKSKTEYTRDPAVLYRWRNAIAETIESGPTGK